MEVEGGREGRRQQEQRKAEKKKEAMSKSKIPSGQSKTCERTGKLKKLD